MHKPMLPNEIYTWVLRDLDNVIVRPLLTIIERLEQMGGVHDEQNKVYVTAIFRKSKNWIWGVRPVSLTCILGKGWSKKSWKCFQRYPFPSSQPLWETSGVPGPVPGFPVRRGIDCLERVQWRATETAKGLAHLTCANSLRELVLLSTSNSTLQTIQNYLPYVRAPLFYFGKTKHHRMQKM